MLVVKSNIFVRAQVATNIFTNIFGGAKNIVLCRKALTLTKITFLGVYQPAFAQKDGTWTVEVVVSIPPDSN